MPNSALFEELGIITATLCVISLCTCIVFAYFELKTAKHMEHIQFIDNIIAFCMLWLIECMLIMLYSMYRLLANIDRYFIILAVFAVFFTATMTAASIDFFKKKKIEPVPFIPVTLSVSLITLLLIASPLQHFTVLNISIAAYSALSLFFTITTLKNNKNITRVGFIYTLSSITLIIANNLLTGWWGQRFSLVLDLSLALMLIMGFFLYYCEIYTASIKDKISSIRQKNDQLVAAEEKILDLAYTDQITHLKNVYTLQEELKGLGPRCVYLLMLNLDCYKSFSGIAGYNRVNAALSDIAAKLKTLIDQSIELYSFYSDKFIFLCSKDYSHCLDLIEDIKRTFRNNRFCPVELKPCIGVTAMSGCRKSFDSLIKELELATQYALSSRLDYAFYSERLSEDFRQKLELEVNLRNAVKNNEWDMYFQPKVSFANNRIVGAEALIRWVNNEKNMSPDIFIPLAEELGLIQDIGRFVIDKTFEYMKRLNGLTFGRLNISINLSPYQLMDDDFIEYVAGAAAFHSIAPENVTFELTESTLIHNIDRINDIVCRLRSLGFLFSLDDFGKGYSSLSYLSQLNLDEVKFDKNFTSSLPKDEKNMAILNGFLKIARELNIHVVVEGIEQSEQYECAKNMGCSTYQGFYFSKPVPFESFVELLK